MEFQCSHSPLFKAFERTFWPNGLFLRPEALVWGIRYFGAIPFPRDIFRRLFLRPRSFWQIRVFLGPQGTSFIVFSGTPPELPPQDSIFILVFVVSGPAGDGSFLT